jgi:hypothetical protein
LVTLSRPCRQQLRWTGDWWWAEESATDVLPRPTLGGYSPGSQQHMPSEAGQGKSCHILSQSHAGPRCRPSAQLLAAHPCTVPRGVSGTTCQLVSQGLLVWKPQVCGTPGAYRSHVAQQPEHSMPDQQAPGSNPGWSISNSARLSWVRGCPQGHHEPKPMGRAGIPPLSLPVAYNALVFLQHSAPQQLMTGGAEQDKTHRPRLQRGRCA